MTEGTPLDPLPGEGPPQAIPPAASAPGGQSMTPTPSPGTDTAPVGEERTFGMLCHLSAFATFVVPFGNILGPLVVWLVKREGSRFVDEQGKEALNFQISITIYAIVSALLVLVLVGIVFLIALAIFWLVSVIVASVRANEGRPYRYPLTIRFLN